MQIAPSFIFTYFLPNQTLGDTQNLIEEHGMLEKHGGVTRDTNSAGTTSDA